MCELIYQNHDLIIYDETGFTKKDYFRMEYRFRLAKEFQAIMCLLSFLTLAFLCLFDFMTPTIWFFADSVLIFLFYCLLPFSFMKKVKRDGRIKYFWSFANKKYYGGKGLSYYVVKYGVSGALSVSVAHDNDTPTLKVLYDCNKVKYDKEYDTVDEILSFDEICQGDCKRAQIIFYREDDDIIKVKYLMAA